ncbi:hypothetical protein GO495_20570 [Chitinophaga oryziterrae]|uniref:Uncharacterized protein n=1 Tax=Chitinophaga oryziterrae TaxID=1031224 RepID=A0A6N8JCR2_9BACT|nr:hypothetical protein [Chitinophaga oryziterrae]MVT43003.1 hypothetical protein [Chitinophaga oryziterrae]
MSKLKKWRVLPRSINSWKEVDKHSWDLSFFEETGDPDFITKIGIRAGINAINENKAMNLPITYMADGWVVQRMPQGDVVRIAEIKTPKEVTRNKKLTKGSVLYVKKSS